MRRVALALIAVAILLMMSGSAWAGPRWRRGYYRYGRPYVAPRARVVLPPYGGYYRSYYPYRGYYGYPGAYGYPGYYGYPRGGVSFGIGVY